MGELRGPDSAQSVHLCLAGWGRDVGELPDLDGVEHSDDRVGWSAMFDADFVLARRTFIGVDDRTVAKALMANGFESMGLAGYSKGCCGDCDAVCADVQDSGTDRVVVELTAADSDWQLAWPLFSGFGVLDGPCWSRRPTDWYVDPAGA